MNQTFENCTLLDTKTWFEKAVPNPVNQNKTTQLGVHCEEVHEMLIELTPQDTVTYGLLKQAQDAMHALAEHLKANEHAVIIKESNMLKFVDALCDQVVTATGTAHMHGVDFVGAMVEVNASNFSKFVDGKPIFNENMKIMKGPNHFKPDLLPYLPK